MAPEQISGKSVDGRADQFAWAVTAYRLLADKFPWPIQEDPLAMAAVILTEVPVPLAQSAPEVPSVVAQTIDRALSYRPEDRFDSMQEIIAFLEPLAAQAISSSRSQENARPPPPHRIDPFGRTEVSPETAKALASDPPTRKEGEGGARRVDRARRGHYHSPCCSWWPVWSVRARPGGSPRRSTHRQLHRRSPPLCPPLCRR